MFKRIVQYRGPTPDLQSELDILDSSGAGGIPGVAVECVEIRKNTDGEGSLLGTNRRSCSKVRVANRIRYPGSPHRKRCILGVRGSPRVP